MVGDQQKLFHDTLEEALEDVIHVLGGPKRVAGELWPSKDPRQAAVLLRHCLNPDRAEKLALDELMLILKAGAAADCHVAAHHIARHCGYREPEKLNPEDEKVRLQREFIAAQRELARLADRIGGLNP